MNRWSRIADTYEVDVEPIDSGVLVGVVEKSSDKAAPPGTRPRDGRSASRRRVLYPDRRQPMSEFVVNGHAPWCAYIRSLSVHFDGSDEPCDCAGWGDEDDDGWQIGDVYYGGIVTKDALTRPRCPDCGDEGWVHIGGPDSVRCATCKPARPAVPERRESTGGQP